MYTIILRTALPCQSDIIFGPVGGTLTTGPIFSVVILHTALYNSIDGAVLCVYGVDEENAGICGSRAVGKEEKTKGK